MDENIDGTESDVPVNVGKELLYQIEKQISSATAIANLVKPFMLSSMREVALVKTKLDEARLWLEEAKRVNGID